MKKLFSDNIEVHGVHRFTVCDISSPKAMKIQAKILELARKPFENRKEFAYWTAQLRSLFGEMELVQPNVFCTAARSAIAKRMAGTLTYSGTINYGALGTSTTSPGASDTQLGAEVYRDTVSSVDISNAANAIIILSFFYSSNSFTNANVNEFGTVIDGTASANTGQLGTHVAFASTINKTNTKSLTVDAQYTLS